jgi:hypothetical protein
MGVIAENHGFDWSPTESLFSPLPIHTALPWTELTIFEQGIGLLNSPSQFTFPFQSLIGRNPSNLLIWSSTKGRGRKEQRAPQEQGILNEMATCKLHTEYSFADSTHSTPVLNSCKDISALGFFPPGAIGQA